MTLGKVICIPRSRSYCPPSPDPENYRKHRRSTTSTIPTFEDLLVGCTFVSICFASSKVGLLLTLCRLKIIPG